MCVLYIKVDVLKRKDVKRTQKDGETIDMTVESWYDANRSAKGMHEQDELLHAVGEPRWGWKLGREVVRRWRKTRCFS
jgi:hypothetical protein